jgi:3-hydroxyacyl-[acyl-carrier-protein] dehydratase
MAPPLLFDISRIDMTRVQFGVDQIERVNPQRGHMRMLDGIIYLSDDYHHGVAYKDVRADEFWVEGHIPGRPIFPGVLMIETAAQFASFMCISQTPDVGFLGFARADDVIFRGQVVPGDRFVLLMRQGDLRRRRSVCEAQGLVNGTLVFEAKVTGMPV